MKQAKRVSKTTILAYILNCIESYEKDYGFNDQDGYAQVEGKGESKNRDYGEYRVLNHIYENIEEGYIFPVEDIL